VSTHDENFPRNLPSLIQTASYVPFGKLLRHCSAIVHHGGIGTTSQAFAAAAPQVVRPMAFDQFDNATRIERLGCGVWLRNDADLASVLNEVLHRENIRDNCLAIASRLKDNEAPAAAARVILDDLTRIARA
jgi:UDP:flavonoid glycosyltransferase YjiC (YdhE family)